MSAAAPARSFVPPATASYLEPDYWDARFAEEETYEWCKVSNATENVIEEADPTPSDAMVNYVPAPSWTS